MKQQARVLCPFRRLYFRMAQATRVRSKCRRTGANAERLKRPSYSIQPRRMGLYRVAIAGRSRSVRLRRFQRRVVRRIVVQACALTAGVKLTNRLFRLLFFTSRGRKV